MEVERARYLTSREGREALASLPPELVNLSLTRLSSELRKQFEPAHAAALGEQLTLRHKASERFDDAGSRLYTHSGLQMMTHPTVARRRAARLQGIGLRVADLTCGLGGDLASLAAADPAPLGVEKDGATAILARENVRFASVVIGTAESSPFDLEDIAIILDPSRRSGGGRRFGPAAFSPSWDACLRLASESRAAVIKGPPGIDDAHILREAEFEVVQLGRSLREGTLWFGHGVTPGLRRAVKLPDAIELTSDAPESPSDISPLQGVLFDPAPCVTRAGLVRHLAAALDARLLDPHLAYLTASAATASPFATAFEVLEVIPFSVARLRTVLQTNGWRPDEIRRRAFPVEPDELRKLLKVREGHPVTLLCMTVDGRRTVVVGRRIPQSV